MRKHRGNLNPGNRAADTETAAGPGTMLRCRIVWRRCGTGHSERRILCLPVPRSSPTAGRFRARIRRLPIGILAGCFATMLLAAAPRGGPADHRHGALHGRQHRSAHDRKASVFIPTWSSSRETIPNSVSSAPAPCPCPTRDSSATWRDLVGTGINQLVDDGFAIGNDKSVNDDGIDYYWIAMQVQAGTLAVGSYVGSGLKRETSFRSGSRPRPC